LDKKTTIEIPKTWLKKNNIFSIPAGLAKSHRIIRTEKDREVQFMKLCIQIRLDDNKFDRSGRQRNDRRSKRFKYDIIR
jgi:hypothetical protein